MCNDRKVRTIGLLAVAGLLTEERVQFGCGLVDRFLGPGAGGRGEDGGERRYPDSLHRRQNAISAWHGSPRSLGLRSAILARPGNPNLAKHPNLADGRYRCAIFVARQVDFHLVSSDRPALPALPSGATRTARLTHSKAYTHDHRVAVERRPGRDRRPAAFAVSVGRRRKAPENLALQALSGPAHGHKFDTAG